MKRIRVIIKGKEYPCYSTMGAWMRFKEETGREITQMDPNSLTDSCVFLWCCIASASANEGVAFDLSFIAFADCVTPEDVVSWTNQLNAEEESMEDCPAKKAKGKSEKKRP